MTDPQATPRQATDGSTVAQPAADGAIAELGFDVALTEFQRVVAQLEAGGQPLEEAIALYERGVTLQAHLDRLLSDAEFRIRRLVERSGGRLETVDHRDDVDG